MPNGDESDINEQLSLIETRQGQKLNNCRKNSTSSINKIIVRWETATSGLQLAQGAAINCCREPMRAWPRASTKIRYSLEPGGIVNFSVAMPLASVCKLGLK